MYLYCLTQENYPGLSKKTKDKLPLAKSKTARSTARPPLLGWRRALVRILVFSFHLLSSSRRWLRWIDSGFLSEGFSVQARSVADSLLQCSYFSFSSEDLEKFEVFPQSGGRREVSSDTIIGWGATFTFKLSKMKLFRASQSSVVHVEAVLTSNQSPV